MSVRESTLFVSSGSGFLDHYASVHRGTGFKSQLMRVPPHLCRSLGNGCRQQSISSNHLLPRALGSLPTPLCYTDARAEGATRAPSARPRPATTGRGHSLPEKTQTGLGAGLFHESVSSSPHKWG